MPWSALLAVIVFIIIVLLGHIWERHTNDKEAEHLEKQLGEMLTPLFSEDEE